MMQKSLGYAIKKSKDFIEFQKKSFFFFEKIKNYKIWAMNLSSDCFVKFFFWSNTLTLFTNIAKETGFLPYCKVKCMACI